jgi:hypothetical protein
MNDSKNIDELFAKWFEAMYDELSPSMYFVIREIAKAAFLAGYKYNS